MSGGNGYSRLPKTLGAAAIVISAFGFFAGLGLYGLQDNNEGLYGQIALSMYKTGDYVIPRANDLIYIEKPPMLYWLTALSFSLFEVNEFAARFTPALAAFLTGMTLYFFLRPRFGAKFAILTLLIWSSTVGALFFARILFFDMLLTFWLTAALCALYALVEEGKRRYACLAYAAVGGAVLTKGILGIAIPGMVMFVYLYWRENGEQWLPRASVFRTLPRRLLSLVDPAGLLVFLAVALPWHILAARAEPDFLRYYFVNEHYLRFLGLRLPMDYYSGPPWYYTWRFLLFLLPWVLLMAWPALKPGIVKATPFPKRGPRLRGFFLIWLCCVFIFFSLSRAKANYYIIAAVPPAVALLSMTILSMSRRVGTMRILVWFARLSPLVTFAAVFGTLALAPFFPDRARVYIAGLGYAPALAVLAGEVIAVSILVWNRLAARVPLLGAMAIALWMSLFMLCASLFMRGSESLFSLKPLFRDMSAEGISRDRLYLYRDYEGISSAGFYAGGPVTIIDSESRDLLYGATKAPDSPHLISMDAFEASADGAKRWIVVRKGDMNGFTAKVGADRFDIWKRYGNTFVVAVK